MKRFGLFRLVFILFSINVYSADVQEYKINDKIYEYHRPGTFEFVTKTPDTYKTFFKESFAQDNWKNLAIIAGSTTLLWYYDSEILKESQRLGRRLGIGNEENTTGHFRVAGTAIFRGPTDLGSALYFLGDGWMHAGIMGGFVATGLYKEDNRALQTGSQLAHGLVVGTIANQILKRSTGRQSPIRVDQNKRGNWVFFPSSTDYGGNTSNYDAFPSGHVATAMMTFTVITENYAEYNYWLKPVQWTWISLLSFEMMNNGVHWASDYPLAIGMGYLFGKIAVTYGRKEKEKVAMGTPIKDRLYYAPIYNIDGSPGLAAKLDF